MARLDDQGCDHRAAYKKCDDDKRPADWKLSIIKIIEPYHFKSYKNENSGKSIAEQVKLRNDSRK